MFLVLFFVLFEEMIHMSRIVVVLLNLTQLGRGLDMMTRLYKSKQTLLSLFKAQL